MKNENFDWVRIIVSIWLLYSVPMMAQAAPNLWWDHIHWGRDKDQSGCVKQASSGVLKDATHHVTVDADSVRSWSDQTIAVVECMRFGDELVVAILVSGSNPDEGAKLFSHLQEGMRLIPNATPSPKPIP